MKFPPDYPYSPPSIRFMTKVWHPNVYEVSEYIRELSISRTCSLSPFRPFPLIRVYVRVLPVSLASLFRSSVPLSPRFLSLSLFAFYSALTAPRCITTVPLGPLVRPPSSLYLPPSAAIAFTTISFYIVTFSACETTRTVQIPGRRRFHRDAGGRGKKKKVKTADSKNCALRSSFSPEVAFIYWRITATTFLERPAVLYLSRARVVTFDVCKTPWFPFFRHIRRRANSRDD